jgi:hypothetical protein
VKTRLLRIQLRSVRQRLFASSASCGQSKLALRPAVCSVLFCCSRAANCEARELASLGFQPVASPQGRPARKRHSNGRGPEEEAQGRGRERGGRVCVHRACFLVPSSFCVCASLWMHGASRRFGDSMASPFGEQCHSLPVELAIAICSRSLAEWIRIQRESGSGTHGLSVVRSLVPLVGHSHPANFRVRTVRSFVSFRVLLPSLIPVHPVSPSRRLGPLALLFSPLC